ncbi:MAG: DM13 domain-containing protein [Candidatus Limnocylindria bacterium]
MIARPLALIRTNRAVQVAVALLLLGGLAFAWWTISPLFVTTTRVETGGAATGGTVVARGSLVRVDEVHHGSGPVSIVELGGRRFVRFENVAIQNGPDLFVFLARGSGGAYDGSRDLDLGSLKATNGTFTYEIPAGVDLSGYRSVVVWCRAFAVLFTYADLRAP